MLFTAHKGLATPSLSLPLLFAKLTVVPKHTLERQEDELGNREEEREGHVSPSVSRHMVIQWSRY